MLGGQLLTSSLAIIPHYNLLLAAYSHQHYLFSTQQPLIKQTFALHSHNIKALAYHAQTQLVHSVDSKGNLLSFTIKEDYSIDDLNKQIIKVDGEIRQCKIVFDEEGSPIVYALCKSGTLLHYHR